MRRLVVSTFVSLDGVAQAPGGPEEDASDGFSLGGWTVPYFGDPVGDAFLDDLMGHPVDLVLGRRTYDVFASCWRTPGTRGRRRCSTRRPSTSRRAAGPTCPGDP